MKNHSTRGSRERRAAAALLGLSALGIASAPAAAAASPNEIHHNIAGVALGGGNIAQLNLLKNQFINANFAGDPLPLAVSLNEMCFSQGRAMEDYIQDVFGLDYTFLFRAQSTTIAACPAYAGSGASKYGVGVLTLGQHNSQTGPFGGQIPGDESRGYACALGGLSSPKYWFCSGHAANANPTPTSGATPQFASYKSIAAALPGAYPKLWAGDLYQTPSDITTAFPTFYSSTKESDTFLCGGLERYTVVAASGALRKWDHIFRNGTTCPTQVATLDPANPNSTNLCSKDPNWGNVCPPGVSPGKFDHRLVAGFFAL